MGSWNLSGSFGVSAKGLRCPMSQNQELIDYVLLLLFGPKIDVLSLKPLINYRTIAKLLKISPPTAAHLVSLGLKTARSGLPVSVQTRRKLKKHHVAYLLDPKTLHKWAHLSLK